MTDAERIARRLLERYPGPKLALCFSNPLELLVAVILSAQCTGARVGEVTKDLFRKYKTVAAGQPAAVLNNPDKIASVFTRPRRVGRSGRLPDCFHVFRDWGGALLLYVVVVMSSGLGFGPERLLGGPAFSLGLIPVPVGGACTAPLFAWNPGLVRPASFHTGPSSDIREGRLAP